MPLPLFVSKKYTQGEQPQKQSGNSWQASGQSIKREGARDQRAATSIESIRRGASSTPGQNRAVSSISRAMSSSSHAGSHSHSSVEQTQEEQRVSDERRYNYIRRLIRARKAKEREAEKKK